MPEGGPAPELEVLVASGASVRSDRILPDPAERELCTLYSHPARAGGVWLRANMISTVDGAAWGATGRSGSINNAADLRAFGAMRAMADVVLVGAGTIRAEGYTPVEVPPALAATRASAGLPATMTTAVVTRSGVLPPAFFTSAAAATTLVLTTVAGAQVVHGSLPMDRVIVSGEGVVDLVAGLAALADRGLSRVLCEGGPTLLGDLLAAALVDELCVTTSPQVVGGTASRIVHAQHYLDPATTPRLDHLLMSGGSLLARWIIAGGQQ